MKQQRGVSYAIEYLWTNQPIRLMTDRLYLLSECTGKVESLGHSLRREARKSDNTNRVNVSYSPDGAGREVAFYTWNPDWKAPERAVKGKAPEQGEDGKHNIWKWGHYENR